MVIGATLVAAISLLAGLGTDQSRVLWQGPALAGDAVVWSEAAGATGSLHEWTQRRGERVVYRSDSLALGRPLAASPTLLAFERAYPSCKPQPNFVCPQAEDALVGPLHGPFRTLIRSQGGSSPGPSGTRSSSTTDSPAVSSPARASGQRQASTSTSASIFSETASSLSPIGSSSSHGRSRRRSPGSRLRTRVFTCSLYAGPTRGSASPPTASHSSASARRVQAPLPSPTSLVARGPLRPSLRRWPCTPNSTSTVDTSPGLPGA